MCGIGALLSHAEVEWQKETYQPEELPVPPFHFPCPYHLGCLEDALRPRGPDAQGSYSVIKNACMWGLSRVPL